MARKSFSGAAVATKTTAKIESTDTAISVTAVSKWPDTTTGPFVVCIDRGTTAEEKILISSYTTTVLTVADTGRGYDGTTAVAHTAGAAVVCTLDADTITSHDEFVNAVGTVAPAASAVGDSATRGTTGKPADAGHRHARESFAAAATTNSAPGDVKADGTSSSPARADHKHGRETTEVQTPVGAVVEWYSTSAPDDWLFLHGQKVRSATWPSLAAVYPSWVTGDTIQLPDTRTRFTMGAGSAHSPGTTGGAASVTLTSGMLPKTTVSITDPGHGHSVNDPGHSHTPTPGYNTCVEASSTVGTATPGDENVTFYEGSTSSNETGISIGSSITGISASFGHTSPTAVTTIPKFIAAHKIVRAA